LAEIHCDDAFSPLIIMLDSLREHGGIAEGPTDIAIPVIRHETQPLPERLKRLKLRT